MSDRTRQKRQEITIQSGSIAPTIKSRRAIELRTFSASALVGHVPIRTAKSSSPFVV